MYAELVAIGSELVLGELVDTNSAHIAQELRKLGIAVQQITAVGDDETLIVATLKQALSRASLVITTGGLGPTEDDKTRQAVAVATDRELVLSDVLLEQIQARFARIGRRMSDNNRQQAYVPSGAIEIENPVGTAPVFIVDLGHATIISLPGVPREMSHLLDNAIVPWLRQRFDLHGVVKIRTLHVSGMGESDLDMQVRDLEQLHNPVVGLAAHIGIVDIRITATGDSEAEADQLIAEVESTARQRLGDNIFGADGQSLAAVALGLRADHNETVAAIEAGTDGKLMAELTRANGSGENFIQGRLMPTFDAPLSNEQLTLLALDIARNHNANYGLACIVAEYDGTYEIGTAIAHSGSGQAKVHLRKYGGYVAYARDWSVNTCLDLLRRWQPNSA